MAAVTDEFISNMRQYLRISSPLFDVEISDLVLAARADLILGGILSAKAEDENDMIVKRAIVCYVKAEFGLDNPDADKYREAYQSIRRHLMLSSDYIIAEV